MRTKKVNNIAKSELESEMLLKQDSVATTTITIQPVESESQPKQEEELEPKSEPKSEPKQEPEYEEEYSGVGSQVFNTMAGNLIQPKQNVTTEDFWAESPSMGMFNTSNAKCPVCGLPESIMQRSVCFDKNCGLKK